MSIPVIWYSFVEQESPVRQMCWDMDFLNTLLPEPMFTHYDMQPPDTDGAVVIIPARYNLDHVADLNNLLHRYQWVVLFLVSDEESSFPWHQIHHRNIRIWFQSPRTDKHGRLDENRFRFLPVGAPRMPQLPLPYKDIPVFFSGQVNHLQRDEMVEHMSGLAGAQVAASSGFTLGLERTEYLTRLSRAKVAPCPSGPASADSFRTWEALELGCVPIVDDGPLPDPEGRAITGYPKGFWPMLCDGWPPFPVIEKWNQGPEETNKILETWPDKGNQVFSWWQVFKRRLRLQLLDDVREVMLNANDAIPPELAYKGSSEVTVLIPTSPTPNNPSTGHLDATIASVICRLPGAEILLMCDGVRSEQEHLHSAYEEYQRRVLWSCNHDFPNVTPIRFDEHLHQVEMTRRTLPMVRTPLIMFVEHDTPLEGDTPFEEISRLLIDDAYDVVRLYHEAVLQPEHKHLMIVRDGVFIRTRQWSQRPHIARKDFYERILHEHFSPDARSMVEDKLHSVVQYGDWNDHRVVIYAPDGDIKRSGHLDARGDQPKYEMVF